MQSVVACVDFTHDPDGVARVGGMLAQRLGARLVLATIVPPPATAWAPANGGAAPLIAAPAAAYPAPTDDPAVLASTREEEHGRLRRLADAHGLDDSEICVRFSIDTPDALRGIARDEDAVFLVVGATRHRALGAAVLGSTSHSLCADAPCPVVVVPGEVGDARNGT